MAKFRKKPVVIEAIQYNGPFSVDEMGIDWGESFTSVARYENGFLSIQTLESHSVPLDASIGDWIIRGVQGEIYPCKPDIFAATYEPAE